MKSKTYNLHSNTEWNLKTLINGEQLSLRLKIY